MSDHDKMMAFGRWLSERRVQQQAELAMLAGNVKTPVDAIRIKAGHLENTIFTLQAFTELYNGDINKFMRERLNAPEEEGEEEKESDEDTTGSA